MLHDLDSMAKIKAPVKLPDGQLCGGAGYPMILTTLAGIEVLGILMSDRYCEGQNAFRHFWRYLV
jgi:hypothetical protein